MNAFHVIGGLLAIWAVVVSAIGFTRPAFPDGKSQERLVIAISAALVAGAIVSAVLTAGHDEKEGEGEHGGESALVVPR